MRPPRREAPTANVIKRSKDDGWHGAAGRRLLLLAPANGG